MSFRRGEDIAANVAFFARFSPVALPDPVNAVLISTANTVATVNSAYNYTLQATDTEGDSLTRGAPILPAWLSFSAASGRLSGTPVDGDVGSHDVSLTVTSSASRFVNQG